MAHPLTKDTAKTASRPKEHNRSDEGDPDRTLMFVHTNMQHPCDKTQAICPGFSKNYRDSFSQAASPWSRRSMSSRVFHMWAETLTELPLTET